MPTPRVLILRAPGTNCDEETAFAFERAGGRAERVHINRWLRAPNLSREFQILCIPGGFSYGDDVAAGRILANQLLHHLADSLRRFQEEGKLVLGICNGFQALLKTGLLVPPDDCGPVATLAWNDCGRFLDRWVDLRVAGPKCEFLSGVETLSLPIAHAEGKFVVRDNDALAQLDRRGQLVLRYGRNDSSGFRVQGSEGQASERCGMPQNPNGSHLDVAGLCDATGRVFGLMPHPERFIDGTQHPRWTRRGLPETGDGLAVFQNAIRYFA